MIHWPFMKNEIVAVAICYTHKIHCWYLFQVAICVLNLTQKYICKIHPIFNLAVFRRPLKIQKCFTWFFIYRLISILKYLKIIIFQARLNWTSTGCLLMYTTYPFKWTYLSFHIHLCVVVHLSEDNSCKSLVQNLNCKQIRIIENSASYH